MAVEEAGKQCSMLSGFWMLGAEVILEGFTEENQQHIHRRKKMLEEALEGAKKADQWFCSSEKTRLQSERQPAMLPIQIPQIQQNLRERVADQ